MSKARKEKKKKRDQHQKEIAKLYEAQRAAEMKTDTPVADPSRPGPRQEPVPKIIVKSVGDAAQRAREEQIAQWLGRTLRVQIQDGRVFEGRFHALDNSCN